MPRSRLRYEFIAKNAARKATYRKRKGGFIKKLNELTALCGVHACAIICSPYDSQPEAWPHPLAAHHMVSRYRVTPFYKKRTTNQETFIRQRIEKVNQQVERLRKENREKETQMIVLEGMAGMGLEKLSRIDVNDTVWHIEKKLVAIHKKMEDMEKEQVYRPGPPLPSTDQAYGRVQRVNDQMSPQNGEHQWWRDNYLAFGEGELHLAFGDISHREKDFWSKLFP